MKIILFGALGSGKGIVGKSLSTKLDLPFIDMGDLLREQVSKAKKAILQKLSKKAG